MRFIPKEQKKWTNRSGYLKYSFKTAIYFIRGEFLKLLSLIMANKVYDDVYKFIKAMVKCQNEYFIHSGMHS